MSPEVVLTYERVDLSNGYSIFKYKATFDRWVFSGYAKSPRQAHRFVRRALKLNRKLQGAAR